MKTLAFEWHFLANFRIYYAMRLFDEIFKNTDNAFCRCTLVIGGEGYFEGVKALGDFSTEKIVVYYPQTAIEIEGEKLSIDKYCDGDLRVKGKILCVRLGEGV